jgi:membrane protease YdiL (CAAX protease family)
MTEENVNAISNGHPPRLTSQAMIGYGVLILLILAGLMFGGRATEFALTGLMSIFFAILAALAYMGSYYTTAKILAVLWMFFLFAGYLLSVVGFGMMAAVGPGTQPETALFEPETATTVGTISGYAIVSLLLALMGFIPAVRRALSRLIPIDPTSFVHAVALVTVIALTLLSIAPLLVLGEPPMLTEAALETMRETGATEGGLLSTLYSLVWSVPIAILAVGYGIRRDFGGALQRLGLVRPTLGQILLGIGVGLALVIGANFLDLLINFVWNTMGWPRTDAEALSEIMAFAMSPLGAVVVAVSAGLGEELAVRGVLQPRLGIILSNFFFAALHAFQYHWDVLLVVFLLGLIFGVLRRYTNTSTAAIGHGVYNFTLIMMAIYGITLLGN